MVISAGLCAGGGETSVAAVVPVGEAMGHGGRCRERSRRAMVRARRGRLTRKRDRGQAYMRGSSSTRLAATAAATFITLVCAASASAQTPVPPAGLGDQLFSTGGEITVEVEPATAGLVSKLRLYNPDGSFDEIATNRRSVRR
jgi:hypothetical protein